MTKLEKIHNQLHKSIHFVCLLHSANFLQVGQYHSNMTSHLL